MQSSAVHNIYIAIASARRSTTCGAPLEDVEALERGTPASQLPAVQTSFVALMYRQNMATGRTVPTQRRNSANLVLVRKTAGTHGILVRRLQKSRGEEVRMEHVKSHTGVRGNEAADKLASLGSQIQDGHRIERNSDDASRPRKQEPEAREHKDNACMG